MLSQASYSTPLLHAALLDMRGLGQNPAAVGKDLFFMFSFIHPVQIKLTRIYSQQSCVLSAGPLGKTRHAVRFHAVCVSLSAALVGGLKSHPCSLNRKRVDR